VRRELLFASDVRMSGPGNKEPGLRIAQRWWWPGAVGQADRQVLALDRLPFPDAQGNWTCRQFASTQSSRMDTGTGAGNPGLKTGLPPNMSQADGGRHIGWPGRYVQLCGREVTRRAATDRTSWVQGALVRWPVEQIMAAFNVVPARTRFVAEGRGQDFRPRG
jgi:hypothetical protein